MSIEKEMPTLRSQISNSGMIAWHSASIPYLAATCPLCLLFAPNKWDIGMLYKKCMLLGHQIYIPQAAVVSNIFDIINISKTCWVF